MIYKLTIVFHSDKDHMPVAIQVGIDEMMAKILQGQKLTTITARIEQAPGYVSSLPILDFKGEKASIKRAEDRKRL